MGVVLVQCGVMARSGYRAGDRQVNVWLSKALHGQVRAGAAAAGVSMQEWMVAAVREKVMRNADAGVGAGGGRSAVPDGCGSGGVSGGDGVADPFELPADESGSVTRLWDVFADEVAG